MSRTAQISPRASLSRNDREGRQGVRGPCPRKNYESSEMIPERARKA